MRKGLSLVLAVLFSLGAAAAVAKYNATGESAQSAPKNPDAVQWWCPPVC
jgi:hypothetical protein